MSKAQLEKLNVWGCEEVESVEKLTITMALL